MADTTTSTPEKVVRSTPSATSRPGDSQVVVQAVSAVDLFNGLDATTSELVRVRVTGIRSTGPCWAHDELAFARNTLDGKQVRLLDDGRGARDPEGRLLVKVQLLAGQDYAETAVAAGAAVPDTGSDTRLTEAEAEARQHRRGVWASTCVPSTPSASGSSQPSSPPPSSAGEKTTETSRTTARPTTPVEVPPQPTVSTAPEPQPPDDIQRGVDMGAPCSPEGVRGLTAQGQEVTCQRKGEDLRWMKA
ncbi:thermonuclease family protein [Lentzea atacamensis]|uniref:thermonuclease family protein n=1 Tax=Lentzea atacamensis TaxID=531938 RepID=UPI001472DD25|nr:thermonuclease family protein [Lentzea atacamensis]